MTRVQQEVFCDIAIERNRQDEKWGSQRALPDEKWATILMEEVGESAKEVLEKRMALLEKELTQVAAVAVAWLEAIKSRKRGFTE